MEKENHLKQQPDPEVAESAARGEAAKSDAGGANGSDTSSVAVPTDLAELTAAYQKLSQEKRDLYDRLLRKQAELENVRKRLEREKEDFLHHATAELVRSLLPTLDGFERALRHRDDSVPEDFYKGIELIYKQLSDVLRRAGLTPVETKGKIFDPHVHEAVETVPSEDHKEHEIVEELQRGYKLRQRLLRPAIVKVAAAPARPRPQTETGSSAGGGKK